jgi:hypothetical protein
MAIMIRAGSPALRMTTTASFLGCLKYGATKSSRLPSGASTMGHAPFLETVFEPVLELLSNISQEIASNAQALALGIKETDHSFGLLKRLNQSVQKNPSGETE